MGVVELFDGLEMVGHVYTFILFRDWSHISVSASSLTKAVGADVPCLRFPGGRLVVNIRVVP